MKKNNRKYKGLLSVEFVVAVSVLATIIGVLVALNISFGKLNNNLWARHICNNAGQAQMDSIVTTGQRIDNDKFEELWPGVTCQIEIDDGVGQWQGLKRVELTLRKKVKQKVVKVHLVRYLSEVEGGTQ